MSADPENEYFSDGITEEIIDALTTVKGLKVIARTSSFAFKNKNIHTFSATTGPTGGVLFYELGPQRPDLILKDLVRIFHPELLPEYAPFFFKPLK